MTNDETIKKLNALEIDVTQSIEFTTTGEHIREIHKILIDWSILNIESEMLYGAPTGRYFVKACK